MAMEWNGKERKGYRAEVVLRVEMESQGHEVAVLPSLEHFDMDAYQDVYEPSDDTFLFCDALLKDKNCIIAGKPLLCVEIGTGSGCLITYLGQLLHQNKLRPNLIATDINPAALCAAKQTGFHNKVPIECVRSSLLSGMEMAVGKVDIMMFNPPYVPTPDDEVHGCGIEASWAGGTDGRVVIDKFLPIIPKYLSPRGVCYLLLVKENKPTEIGQILRNRYNLKSEVVIERRARNERLLVMKISRMVMSCSEVE